MSVDLRHFVVSAQCGGGARSATRCKAASAMVLADLWGTNGCEDITLTDRQGQRHTRDQFRVLLCARREVRPKGFN